MISKELCKPTPEIIRNVRKRLDLDEVRIKEAVEGLKRWLELQPHLPNAEDDGRLERWLIRCKNNMEKTKQTIDMYYSLKTLVPELMCGRDVTQPWFDTTIKYGYFAAMPELTPDMDRVSIFGLSNLNLEDDFNLAECFKTLLCVKEVRMCEDYYVKDIYIFDLKNVTLSFITKVTPTLLKKLQTCSVKGYNTRIRNIHIVNVSPSTEVLINLIKSVAKKKIAQRLHVHGGDFKELHKQIPRRILPIELGGDAGTIQENCLLWQKKIRSYRDWFMKRENLKADELKRPNGYINGGEMFGINGSFRQLSID